jgi:Cu-Zn family superoxide dismutase
MWRSNKRRLAVGALVLSMTGAAVVATTSPASADRPLVRATLVNAADEVVGEVVFSGQGSHVTRVEVLVRAAAAPGLGDFHGFHIHTVGACDPLPSGSPAVPFGSAGGHWNPTGVTHGSHAGDMPSLLLQADGKSRAEFDTDRFPVSDLLEGDGSAVVLHAGRDNFANIPATAYSSFEGPVPNTATKNTGDAGGRYACGVVRPA